MKILVVDGPEKAGKTTALDFIHDLLISKGFAVGRKKFGAPPPGESRHSVFHYLDAISEVDQWGMDILLNHTIFMYVWI